MYKLIIISLLNLFMVTVFGQPICSTNFNYSIGNNNVVTFTGNSSSSCIGTTGCCATYDFGDSISGRLNRGVWGGDHHFYKYPGIYTVCKTFSFYSLGCGSCMDSVCKQITITDTGTNCQARFCYEAVDSNGFLQTTFYNTSTSDDSIVTVIWDFDDGIIGILDTVYHWFAVPVPVQLTYLFIETSSGCQSEFVDTIVTGNTCTFISGTISTETNVPIPGAEVTLSGDLSQTTTTGSDGKYSFNVEPGGSYTITPSKSNDSIPNNGITSLDVLLMRKHILGIAPLPSPYKIIAAAECNAAGDTTITTQDILFTRSLILGNISSFPTNRLWQFVPSDYVFPDNSHPFPFPTSRTYTNITTNQTNQNFIGIKLGDVNGSWDPNVP